MRPVRDPERTRASILAAATAEFARHGLGGARVDRIAERAGSNKRMLYYYFGDKEGLFQAVLEQTYADIRSAEQKLNLLDATPEDGVRRLIELTWAYYIAHPEFLTLLNSENLHRAKHLRKSSRIREMNSPLIETLAELLRRGQRAGSFRKGVDPLQLYISIAALAYFYLSNRHTLSTVFARDLFSPKERKARVTHMCQMVLGFLAPPASARRTR
ncbi:MAG TPA: TetR/AcrR family transcriptional regulator [Casimicrobiaceae bacterium]|jgi:AcrR family transcriptional regulator